jgi:hypothetical protein
MKTMNNIKELKPREAPQPHRPFVNRERELGIIQRKVDIGIRGDPMPSVVTCFWGPFGMGKSWLLGEIDRRYRFSGLREVGNRPSITARLDLTRKIVPIWKENRLNHAYLIRELWKQLASQMKVETPDLELMSDEKWADMFVNRVTAWSSNNTILLILDTVDELLRFDEQSFFWLEEKLVERLAITSRVLLIFSSRGELRNWRRFQVRQRVDSYRLTAFDSETAGKQIRASRLVSEVLFQHAFGHPLVTEYLASSLENSILGQIRSSESIKLSLVQEVLEKVIDEVLHPLSQLEVEIARNISVLRWISVEPFRFLAEKMNFVDHGRGDVYYLDLIAMLQAHHILYWDSNQKNYEFDPVLRHLLMHFLELAAPSQFALAHLSAFEFHRDHLDRYPQYLARYVPELAYHCIILSQCASFEPPVPTVQDWWERFLEKTATDTSPEPWEEMRVALEQDIELQKLSPVDYESLITKTKARATSLLDFKS